MRNELNDVVIAYYTKGNGYTQRHVLTVNYTIHTFSYDDVFTASNIRNVTHNVYDLKVTEVKKLRTMLEGRGFHKDERGNF